MPSNEKLVEGFNEMGKGRVAGLVGGEKSGVKWMNGKGCMEGYKFYFLD
jgi:hypothetical protein